MTLYGCSVPIEGFGPVTEFQNRSGVPLGLIRCYPGPKVLADGLASVRKAISLFPGRAICWNSKTAGRGHSQAQMTAFVKAIEVEAAKVPRFFLVPDAEPDRKDRTYTDDEFMASFTTLARLCKELAPHVEISLNLTGYDFKNRIGRYRKIKPLYQILSLDPYWTRTANAVQGTTQDLAVAAYWAAMNHKKLALAEWGAEGGDPGWLKVGLDWVRQHNAEFSAYYQEDNAPIPAALHTPEAFAVYRAGVS